MLAKYGTPQTWLSASKHCKVQQSVSRRDNLSTREPSIESQPTNLRSPNASTCNSGGIEETKHWPIESQWVSAPVRVVNDQDCPLFCIVSYLKPVTVLAESRNLT